MRVTNPAALVLKWPVDDYTGCSFLHYKGGIIVSSHFWFETLEKIDNGSCIRL